MLRMKKLLGIALCLVMIITALAGCGGNQAGKAGGESAANNGNSSAKEQPKEIVEISYLSWDRGSVPSSEGSIEDNWWTKYVNKNLASEGVKVKFIPVPWAEEGKVLPTLMAAGNAPDLCYTTDKNIVSMFIGQGGVVDYTPYLEKNGKNITSKFSKEDLDAGKFSGKQYTLRSRSESIADSTWMRKDWLDKLGMKPPKNIDELYNVLKAFKEKDPGKVGKNLMPMVIPKMHTYWDYMVMTAFVNTPPSGERLVTPFPLWPEAKDSLKFLNKLYNEGLLGDLVLDKKDELLKQGIVRGEIGAVLNNQHYPFHPAYGSLYAKLKESIPDAKIISVQPWTKGDKEPHLIYNRGNKYRLYFFTPKSSKRPEQAVKLLNWMATDETIITSQAGLKDEHYKIGSDGIVNPVTTKVFQEKVSWIEPQYQTFAKLYFDDMIKYAQYLSQSFDPKISGEFVEAVKVLKNPKYTPPVVNLPTPVGDKYLKTIATKWEEETVPVLITAPAADFDKMFDKALEEYRKNGGDDVAAEAVKNYKEQNK